MIRSFRDPETERLFQRKGSRRLSSTLARVALRKLLMIDAAESLIDLRVSPGNRLEKLTGTGPDNTASGSTISGVSVPSGGSPMPTTSRSLTITKSRRRPARRRLAPIHPGEVLLEEFLKPHGITQYRLAKELSVPPRRINEIAHGKRSISADTALRLARYFGTSEQFWLNLQARYDLEMERDRLGDRLLKEVSVLAPAV